MSFLLNNKASTLKCFALVLLFLSAGLLNQGKAQSGRRTTRSNPASIPVPSPNEADSSKTDPPLVPSSGSLQQKVQLLIGRHPTQRRLQSEDVIFASFVNRLNGYPNVAGTAIGNLNRDQAVKRAKRETGSLVVLLSFEIDRFQGGTIILNSPDLVLEYLVLAPQTGKHRTKGKIYFQAIGGGRMRKSDWPGGTPIRITPEAAGLEAAEHVHDWLRLEEVRKRQTKK